MAKAPRALLLAPLLTLVPPALPGAGPAPALAQCSYSALSSGTGATASASPAWFSFNQTSAYWTAVAVRPAPGEDWNLDVYGATAAAPACVSGLLASSTRATGVDLVVGDFNAGHNSPGLRYPRATRAVGSGGAVVEWDDGPHSLFVNYPLVNRSTGPSDVIEVWDVGLTAGVPYTFTFQRAGADVRLLLFKSAAGPYWAGRSAALFETTGNTTFTPSETGFYGVVVVNDDGAAGSYSLGVGTCLAPSALVSGAAVSTLGFAERYHSFDQSHAFWTAVGVRGASNWNLEVYQGGSGSSFPSCFTHLLSSSLETAPTVDFVVGNFNRTLVGTHFARVHLDQQQGGGSGMVEWDDGPDFVAVDGPQIARATGPTDVLEVWDVFLDSLATYQVLFSASGADLRLFLFDPTLAWGKRGDALFQRSPSPAYQPYTATRTGWHGLVVVNQDGASGSYVLRVGQTMVSVEGEGGPPTEFGGVAPNPVRGPARIAFSLHEAAEVSFEILDVAGRRVAHLPPRRWASGRWTALWSGAGEGGGRLAPGVYFARMSVGGRPVALRKITVLD